LFAGNASNLASGAKLSTKKLQQPQNNFSFFACQAENPSIHKGFRRFQERKQSGKNFSPGHQCRRTERLKNPFLPLIKYPQPMATFASHRSVQTLQCPLAMSFGEDSIITAAKNCQAKNSRI